MEKICLVPGCRFSPRDSELVQFYLKPKILGQNLPCKFIQEREVFGVDANPWQVFDTDKDSWMVSEVGRKKVMYIFSHATKKANSTASLIEKKRSTKKEGSVRENFCKKAGCGTWSGKTKPQLVKDDKNRVIGEKRYLVFQINEIGANIDFNKVRGHYGMHYYTLLGVEQDIVLCKITLDLSKKTQLKLKVDGTPKTKKDEKRIIQRTRAKKNQKNQSSKSKNNQKTINLVHLLSDISCETHVNLGSAREGVVIVNSASNNNFSGAEVTDDQGLQEDYIGAITTDTCDFIECNEREGVYESVEVSDGSQVMESYGYQEDDIQAMWYALSIPNLDDVMDDATGVAGCFDETNETPFDSTPYGGGENELYISEVLNTVSELPSNSCDPHEVDLYFDIEALLEDLNSRGEEPAVFENSRSKLLGKRKVVAEIPREPKRYACLENHSTELM